VSDLGPLRAPTRDGAIVAVPPLEQAANLTDANRRRLDQSSATLLGQPLTELRRFARREVLALAGRLNATPLPNSQETPPPNPLPEAERGRKNRRTAAGYLEEKGREAPLLVAGHQPDLFHPGVWLKNFALAGLARRQGGVALNLVVDNDTLKVPALRVPVPPSARTGRPHALSVPYDRWVAEVPFEERRVEDHGLFDSFADRALDKMRGWGYEPILPGFWADVRQALTSAHGLVGEAFAAARRLQERRWGCHNLEVPISAICASESFACFAAALLADLPRFVALYNQIVRDYRAAHGIRSSHHPVPDLASDADWLEAPLWGWRAGGGRRGRLFVRARGDRLELRAGDEVWPQLPSPRHPDFVQAWRALASDGLKVRSRALTTTLFARLLLADLFVHGIGGGKYDELTDELMRAFFGVEAPGFLVLSGTLWLPLPAFSVGPEDRRRLIRQLRELLYQPERHLSAELQAVLAEPIRQKAQWIAQEPADHAGRRRRFAALRGLNEQLGAPLAGEAERTRGELQRTVEHLQANAVLRRRDYSFCLYPEAVLRPFCMQMC
jgi:hypothetical protein